MTLIFCLDDKLGMAFNSRRQSRDSAVCGDIVQTANGAPISMDERSKMLFEGMNANIADGGEFYFLEFAPPSAFADSADRMIVYRWNRHYPADLHCDIDLGKWSLAETSEFPGSSHEKITKEVYAREIE